MYDPTLAANQPLQENYQMHDVEAFTIAHNAWLANYPVISNYTDGLTSHEKLEAAISVYPAEPIQDDYQDGDTFMTAHTIWEGNYPTLGLYTSDPTAAAQLATAISNYYDEPVQTDYQKYDFVTWYSAYEAYLAQKGYMRTADFWRTFTIEQAEQDVAEFQEILDTSMLVVRLNSIHSTKAPVAPASQSNKGESDNGSSNNSSVSISTPNQSKSQAIFMESRDYSGVIKDLTKEEVQSLIDRVPVAVDAISEIPTKKQLFIAASALNRFDTPLTNSKTNKPLEVSGMPSGSHFSMGSAVQGPECMKTVLAYTQPGDRMLRSFSLTISNGGKQLSPTELTSTKAFVSVLTADKTLEEGYKYVLMCVESGGKVVEYEDTDSDPSTISADVNNFGAFFVVKRPIK